MHVKSKFGPIPAPMAAAADQNVHDLLNNSPVTKDDADGVVFIDSHTGEQRTRAVFNELVYDAATALVTPVSDGGFGFQAEGEIVGIFSGNCIEYPTIVHGLLRAAIPMAFLQSTSTQFELVHQLKIARATRLFVHAELLSLALGAAREVGLAEDRVYVLEGTAPAHTSLPGAIAEIRKRKIARVPSRPAKRDTLAYLVFSSGTSGLPKAVMVTHGNVITSFLHAAIVRAIDPVPRGIGTARPVLLGFLPMYHTYGLHYLVLRPALGASTIVVVSKWNVGHILNSISRYRINFLPLVPPAIHQLVNSPEIAKADLSSVLLLASGAAHLPLSLADKLVSYVRNCDSVSTGFGMSECTIACLTPAPPQMGGLKRSGNGILLPGMEARIVRADGSPARQNEVGELWIKGANVVPGYWQNEAATREVFRDGWYLTGDMFRVDADGEFYFIERNKDTLKVSGHQVSPTEIENVLLAHPDRLVADVSVAGVSGGRTRDEKVPRAWVVLSERGKKLGEKKAAAALEAWSRKSLSKYKWLRGGIEFVDEIPKSATGKVLRRVLQMRYEEQVPKRPSKAKAKL